MPSHSSPHPTRSGPQRLPSLAPDESAVLQCAVQLGYVTVPLLVCHLDCSPDSAYRRLRRLCRLGFLRSERWQPGARTGTPSIVAAITARGAHALIGATPLPRPLSVLVRRSAARLRSVAAGAITTLAHDLAVGMLVGLLRRAFPSGAEQAAGTPLLGERFRLDRTVPLARLSLTVRGRLGLLPPGSDAHVSFLPDAVLSWTDSGRTGALVLEVETGIGGRTPEDIGAIKATQFAALWRRLQGPPDLGRAGAVDPAAIHFVLWCPTERFRQKLLSGVASVLDAPLPLVTLTGTDVPLAPPPGTPKEALRPWVAEAAVRFRSTLACALPQAATLAEAPAHHLPESFPTPSPEAPPLPEVGHFSLLTPL